MPRDFETARLRDGPDCTSRRDVEHDCVVAGDSSTSTGDAAGAARAAEAKSAIVSLTNCMLEGVVVVVVVLSLYVMETGVSVSELIV
jgi:hypothetical protein